MNRLAASLLALLWTMAPVWGQGSAFVNFETAPLHPVAISADGRLLAVCNLPDGRVELFDLTQGKPKIIGSVFTGLDPVSARFNHRGELWVVNHISDTITIIDQNTLAVLATLETFDAPADVVFTKNPARAYVSHTMPNLVEVWDLETRASLDAIEIEGDRPKALSLSADESAIYIAILESGNASTIIAPQLTALTRFPQHSVIDHPDGPQRGQNPAPNSGDVFAPIINPSIPATNLPPKVSLIVKKKNGRWMDDNFGDWTEFISGTNSFLTGRVPGWDIADHDLGILKTSDHSVRYVRGLMNICFDVAANPVSGKVAVIGTEALNEVRFEPVLKSIFTRAHLALVDPQSLASQIRDLNPHLDYKRQTLPLIERRQSVGDPRGSAWNSRGDRLYVTGMGSNNLLMLDENGNRIGAAVQLPEGPTGIVFDGKRNQVHVFCRFESKLVTLDADSLQILSSTSIHDSTPAAVRVGRRHFYNTIENSGLGLGSCAACHVDGRFDRLAWDLGDMTGEMIKITTDRNFTFAPAVTNHFHPMKGPMTTQTLQDIITHEPFHWRGDRDGIEEFAPTFVGLQGADEEPTAEEMQEFKDFLASMTFPPNPFRNLDNTLPTSLDLPSERTFGRGTRANGQPLPRGSAVRGMNTFRSPNAPACILCHTLPTGLGTHARFLGGRWQTVPLGPNQERHVAMIGFERSHELPFKVQHLRNLFEKIGFDTRVPVSRSGFGFFHDGRVDSLTRLLQDGFALTDDQQTADIIAFLLAFTGSDMPAPVITDPNRAPGLPSKDVHAGVGLQAIQTNSTSSSRVLFMMTAARATTSRVDLIVRGVQNQKPRAWLMRGLQFVSDKNETNTTAALLQLAAPDNPLTFTLVPLGSGRRLALDRDGDNFFNQIEIDAGSDPADPNITPETAAPRIAAVSQLAGEIRIEFFGRAGAAYRVQSRAAFGADPPWSDHSEEIRLTGNSYTWTESHDANRAARFYRIVHLP